MKSIRPSPLLRRIRLSLLLSAAALLAGCSSLSGGPGPENGSASEGSGMTLTELEVAFASQVDAIEGPSGAIRTLVDGINVYLVSDPENDRMRIMAPLTRTEGIDQRIFTVLLEANFHRTLDARYAMSEGVIYAIYLHPISSLTPEQVHSALDQVVNLGKTFGTTFTSGRLHFGEPIGGER